MAEEEGKKITILYEKSKNHISIPVTGAYGGLSPDAKTVITNLYLEQHTIPNYSNVGVKGPFVDFSNEERITRGNISREIQATLMLTPETAIGIGKWLIKRGEEALEIRNRERKEN